ncbi:MAG: hypothetical protein K8S56_05835 [Candidatus Cloacimonetes bacterium]|nr:hypothetical protein [Candidatus Cloacimonadota bacterium]
MRKIILLIAALLLLITACEKKEEKGAWTILVYMAADNGLSQNADIDINEMEAASFPADIQVVVQIDRPASAPEPDAVRYHITHDETDTVVSPVVSSLGEINSADWVRLTEFVNWGIGEYPAENYALVIWSHGNGWYRNQTQWICMDNDVPEGSTCKIEIANGELCSAFAAFESLMDIVIFDACNM